VCSTTKEENMAKKVLIVDDAAFMRMTLRDILTKNGYEIAGEAETGEEAVTKYGQLKPDLVTMDIVMLGEGGIKAVKEIIAKDQNAKILMVSAMGQQALVVEAIQAGAKGFVIKPFKPETVADEVKRIIGK
jgi:two-component system chemotaxis response regulator CheY